MEFPFWIKFPRPRGPSHTQYARLTHLSSASRTCKPHKSLASWLLLREEGREGRADAVPTNKRPPKTPLLNQAWRLGSDAPPAHHHHEPTTPTTAQRGMYPSVMIPVKPRCHIWRAEERGGTPPCSVCSIVCECVSSVTTQLGTRPQLQIWLLPLCLLPSGPELGLAAALHGVC